MSRFNAGQALVERRVNSRRNSTAAIQNESTMRAEKAFQIESDRINAGVAIHLARLGVNGLEPSKSPKRSVEAEVEKLLDRAASDRFSRGENAWCVVLLLLCLWGFYNAWYIGVFFFVWFGIYASKKMHKYKEAILAKGKIENQRAQQEAAGNVQKPNAP